MISGGEHSHPNVSKNLRLDRSAQTLQLDSTIVRAANRSQPALTGRHRDLPMEFSHRGIDMVSCPGDGERSEFADAGASALTAYFITSFSGRLLAHGVSRGARTTLKCAAQLTGL